MSHPKGYAEWSYSPSHHIDNCTWLSRIITIRVFGCSAHPAFRLPNTEYRTVSPFLNVEAWAFQPNIENNANGWSLKNNVDSCHWISEPYIFWTYQLVSSLPCRIMQLSMFLSLWPKCFSIQCLLTISSYQFFAPVVSRMYYSKLIRRIPMW